MLNSQLSLLSLRLQVQPVYQAFKSSSILFQSSYWALAGSRFKPNLSCWRFSPSHFQILAPSLAIAKMMKLLRLFSSRNQLSNRDALSLHAFTHSTSFSTARQNFSAKGSISDKVYAPFSIFKGKAAVSLTPILPTFTKLESGTLVVDRRGAVMLKFTPAIGERKYDWEKTQVFALSATEVGSLISLGPKDSCELLHDPSMKSSNAGQVRKSLSIKPHADGGGYFISLNVVNNLLKTRESLSVPITTAEFAVMKTACSFALPHIMGWDRLTNKMQRGVEGRESRVEPQLLDEWDR